MKFLKITGIIIAVLLVVIVLLYFIAPRSSYFERSIVINEPPEKIYAIADNMSQFNLWSPWYEMDTTSLIELEGPETGPGARMNWESDALGDGSMWIESDQPSREVVYKIKFAGYDGLPVARLLLDETAEGTKVTWTYEEENSSGLYRIGNLFSLTEMMLKEPYEDGLQNLKEYAENLPDEQLITVTDMPAITYAGIETIVESANSDAIGMAMGQSYGKIMQFLQEQGREMTGMPFAIYPAFDETSITMICAIPANTDGLEETGEINIGEIPAGSSIKAIHKGSYNDLHLTHTAIGEYLAENNLSMGAPPYEQYITDPGNEPDTSKWITWVVYPLAR